MVAAAAAAARPGRRLTRRQLTGHCLFVERVCLAQPRVANQTRQVRPVLQVFPGQLRAQRGVGRRGARRRPRRGARGVCPRGACPRGGRRHAFLVDRPLAVRRDRTRGRDDPWWNLDGNGGSGCVRLRWRAGVVLVVRAVPLPQAAVEGDGRAGGVGDQVAEGDAGVGTGVDGGDNLRREDVRRPRGEVVCLELVGRLPVASLVNAEGHQVEGEVRDLQADHGQRRRRLVQLLLDCLRWQLAEQRQEPLHDGVGDHVRRRRRVPVGERMPARLFAVEVPREQVRRAAAGGREHQHQQHAHRRTQRTAEHAPARVAAAALLRLVQRHDSLRCAAGGRRDRRCVALRLRRRLRRRGRRRCGRRRSLDDLWPPGLLREEGVDEAVEVPGGCNGAAAEEVHGQKRAQEEGKGTEPELRRVHSNAVPGLLLHRGRRGVLLRVDGRREKEKHHGGQCQRGEVRQARRHRHRRCGKGEEVKGCLSLEQECEGGRGDDGGDGEKHGEQVGRRRGHVVGHAHHHAQHPCPVRPRQHERLPLAATERLLHDRQHRHHAPHQQVHHAPERNGAGSHLVAPLVGTLTHPEAEGNHKVPTLRRPRHADAFFVLLKEGAVGGRHFRGGKEGKMGGAETLGLLPSCSCDPLV
eukprot:Rhum_TRINITY_DN11375_c0_g1::Rhum_TRINITY_DN11375_c0_g1_i1::g.43753::m.43753